MPLTALNTPNSLWTPAPIAAHEVQPGLANAGPGAAGMQRLLAEDLETAANEPDGHRRRKRGGSQREQKMKNLKVWQKLALMGAVFLVPFGRMKGDSSRRRPGARNTCGGRARPPRRFICSASCGTRPPTQPMPRGTTGRPSTSIRIITRR